MKSPLWILNSAFLVLCCVVLLYLAVSKVPKAYREPLSTEAVSLPVKPDVSVVNIARIYESDLFGTYHMPVAPVLPAKEEMVVPIPEPPQPRPVFAQNRPLPQFMPPLNMTLKGTIIDNEEADSYAIFANNATKEEKLYKAGSTIEDAYIVKVDHDRVSVIRSNGQQETIFISPDRLKKEPYFAQNKTWETVVQRTGDNQFIVDPEAFANRVKSLATLISQFDLTTVFDKGKSLGVRISSQGERALSTALGFEYGDVITHIDNLPVRTTKERVAAYNAVISKKIDATCTVKVIRGQAPKTLTYTFTKIQKEEPAPSEIFAQKSLGAALQRADHKAQKLSEAAAGLSAELESQKPITQQIKKENRSFMLNHGGQNQTFSRQNPPNP